MNSIPNPVKYKLIINLFNHQLNRSNPSRRSRPLDPAGSCRKAPELAGSGSSIPTGNLSDFFPVDSTQFPLLSGRNRSEIIGKNPKIFRWEYCFHVPAIFGAFLPEPARNFPPGNESDLECRNELKNYQDSLSHEKKKFELERAIKLFEQKNFELKSFEQSFVDELQQTNDEQINLDLKHSTDERVLSIVRRRKNWDMELNLIDKKFVIAFFSFEINFCCFSWYNSKKMNKDSSINSKSYGHIY
jgi:hypothetical protein